MIRLYAENETDFENNGLAVLDADIKENTVEEKMNGIYEFDFAYLSSGKYANLLDGDMIVKAPTPDGDQLFRIIKVKKNIGYLEVNCYHIFYDLAGNFIEDINIVGQNGQDALDHMDTGMQYPTRFKFMSNISQARNARMVRLNAVQALLDASQDNSFLSRWGGEIKRDNFTVSVNDVRGNDKGFKVQHGKNLTGYEAEIDYSTVVTKIMPYGYDGLMLPEKYVDSPLKDKYAFTRIKKIEYKDIKAIDPDATTTDEDAVPLEQAYAQLRTAASREFSVNKIDIPTSNFKITFKNLADTKEYADFKALEKALPWDYVTVVTPDFNITSRMISYQYDALIKQYKKIELGNYVPAFTDTTTNLVNNVNDGLANLTDDINHVAKSADGKNSNYYGPNEPLRPVNGDLWYKKNGDKTELWQYDGKSVPPGWKLLVDDSTGEEVKQRVKEVGEQTQQAIDDANDAVANANNAVEQAGFAHDTAETAKTDAVNALEQATAAYEHADGINKSLTAEIDTVNNSLDLKANKTDVKRIDGTVNELQADVKLQADEISSKVSQNDVKGMLNGYATQNWTQSQIKQSADSINLSVNNVENKIDNLQVGGRNYLLGSDQSLEKAPNSSLIFTSAAGFLDVVKGKQIVISFDIDVKNAVVKSDYKNRAGVSLTFIKNDDTRFYAEAWYTPNIYGDSFKGRVYGVVTVPDDVVGGATTAGLFNQINADQIRLSRPKISVGNTKDDWTSAPEDYASVKKLSELQVTVDGIQGTVQNKADKSQITQLADQITSVVGTVDGLNNANRNYLINSDFSDGTSHWGLPTIEGLNVGRGSYYKIGHQMGIHMNGTSTERFKGISQNVVIPGKKGNTVSVSFLAARDGAQPGILHVGIHWRDKKDTILDQTWQDIATNNFIDGLASVKSMTFKAPVDFDKVFIMFYVTPNKQINIWLTKFKLEIGSQTSWTPAIEDGVTESQITQLQNDINLRVTKNGVINQINISPESILIDGKKVHITGQTSIDNAVIKDAMIASIKADKITTGTLNASKVNLINLNASNITTGVIRGANLSINLNNGEILFQKGAIKSTNGKLNININQGIMAVTNENGDGVRFYNGSLYLSDNYWNWNSNVNPSYGSISYHANFGAEFYGMIISGKKSAILKTDDYNGTLADPIGREATGAGFITQEGHAKIDSEGITYITGGKLYNDNFAFKTRASIGVGGLNGSGKDVQNTTPTDSTGNYLMQEQDSDIKGSDIFIKGNKITLQGGHDSSFGGNATLSDLNIFDDGKAAISSAAIYNRTYSSGSHVVLTKYGTIGRLTSARKYKIADQVADQVVKKAKRILAIKPAEWYDKAEIEAIANAKTKGTDAPPEAMIEKHYGFIADDFDEAGLNEVVLYKNGKVDSLEYERISMYHNVILSDHENRISALENEMKRIRFLERSKH